MLQRKEAEERAVLARKQSEEQLKLSAEAHKREYQAQLALEVSALCSTTLILVSCCVMELIFVSAVCVCGC